ncbi:MAG: hypothetical protein WC494_00715 [Candidatus Pacearchaeota archaeon]
MESAVCNVHLTLENSSEENGRPYLGDFILMEDGQLISGKREGLTTLEGTVDEESGFPIHVDFENGDLKYLHRKGDSHYLLDTQLEFTRDVVDGAVRFSERYRT